MNRLFPLGLWRGVGAGFTGLWLAAACQAAPVTLAWSASSTAVHEYFVSDPTIAAWVQLAGGSGSWALEPGTAANVSLGEWIVGTGAPVPECCATEVFDFQQQVTVAGVTATLTTRAQAKEIANNQYQFNLLDSPETLFDLGAMGVLHLSVQPAAFQALANSPFGGGGPHGLVARLEVPTAGVPEPTSLALAVLALAVAAQGTRRQG